jgi:hypothetical protein
METRQANNSIKKIGIFSGPGTRRWPRYDISQVPWIERVSSNVGSKVTIVNISQGGVLLEAHERIALRTRIILSLETPKGVVQCRGVVIRTSLTYSKGIPYYQAAVSFESPVHFWDEFQNLPYEAILPLDFIIEFFPEGSGLSLETAQNPGSAFITSFLTTGFSHAPHSAGSYEGTGLNDW